MSSFFVENFGCRATQADGAALERQFEERGLARANSPREAEVVVLNTCTVTSAADHDARAAIRRVQRQNPQAKIVVTGCYAQRAPEELAQLPGVSCVVGNSHKHQLADLALQIAVTTENQESSEFIPVSALTDNRQLGTANSIFISDIFAHTQLLAAPVFDAPNERTRPNLKVQDGCDNRCSFCVIPYVRGQSRSLPLPEIIAQVNTLVAGGYREVVISGINLGRWGKDLVGSPQALTVSAASKAHGLGAGPDTRSPRFEDLVRAILSDTSLEKLRISSVEPMDWSDELIDMVATSSRIAKHAHVPMQSGSDAVLRRMHRKYRPWHYREKIVAIRAAMPAAAIGADVMVGFPGETDAEFDETRRMIEELPFTYLHVFTYSPRPGTPAAHMGNQVPVHIARERNRILRELAAEKKLGFMRSFVGKRVEAITLTTFAAGAAPREESIAEWSQDSAVSSKRKFEYTEALTDNYLKLQLRGRHDPNQWVRARVEDVAHGALVGAVERESG